MMRLSMPVVALTVFSMPRRSKVAWLKGLFTRATTLGTPNFSSAIWAMMMLSSSSPVTATTMSARPMPAFSRTQISVPSPKTTYFVSNHPGDARRSGMDRCSTTTISCPS